MDCFLYDRDLPHGRDKLRRGSSFVQEESRYVSGRHISKLWWALFTSINGNLEKPCSGSLSRLETYLEPSRTSAMDFFCENSQRLKIAIYFRKKAPS